MATGRVSVYLRKTPQMIFEKTENYTMTIKHRGVKIVAVKITRYEVRTVDNRKLKTFGSTSQARAWIDGYVEAVKSLTPKEPEKPMRAPRKRRVVNGDAAAPMA
jgi:hypothetical protein